MLRGILYENRANTENGSAADEFREAANHAVIFFKRRKSPPPHTPAIFANLTVTPPEFHPEAFTLSRIRHAANRALASLAASEFITPEEMKKEDRLVLIRLLKAHHAFDYQKAVPFISERLGVSRYTVYNYLKEVEEPVQGKPGPQITG